MLNFEKILNIKTEGRDDSDANYSNFPYEATPYEVLDKLISSNYINKDDILIDYGCGKGRVGFYISYMTKAKVIGVELSNKLYLNALDNLESNKNNRVSFKNINAVEYKLTYETCAYFFNPFSTKILINVVDNIIQYALNNKIKFKLFFYYPSSSYLNYLDNNKYLKNIDIIDLSNIFKNDSRELILVYEVII